MKRKSRLKLYVWDDFAPDWSSGLAVAIASNETEARRLVEAKIGYNPGSLGDVEIFPLTRKAAFAVSGGS